jgi:hypothetical protein
VKQKLNSFKDSVMYVMYNQYRSYLAIADISGMVMVSVAPEPTFWRAELLHFQKREEVK